MASDYMQSETVIDRRIPESTRSLNVDTIINDEGRSNRPQIFTATSVPPVPADGYKTFTEQVGGHLAVQDSPYFMLDDEDNILKLLEAKARRKCMEEIFYETVFKKELENKEWAVLRTFLPQYFGPVRLIQHGKHLTYLKMENLTKNLEKPCIIDIKIGKKTFDPFADPHKIERELIRYKYQAQLGFRVTGFKVFKAKSNETELYDRFHCKGIQPQDITNTFSYFFDLENFPERRLLVLETLRKLKHLLLWFEKQTRIKFFRTSLLIAYDGSKMIKPKIENMIMKEDIGYVVPKSLDKSDLYSIASRRYLNASLGNLDINDVMHLKTRGEQDLDKLEVKNCEHNCVVSMIDFAHTFCDLEDMSNCIDENYIFGLTSVIRELERSLDYIHSDA